MIPAAAIAVAAPVHYPEVGLYHPRAKGRIVEELGQLPHGGTGDAGTVGVLVMRSYVLGGNSAHYDGVLCALEAEWFWIANTMYFGFALSSLIGGVASVVAYRRGLV